MAVNILIASKGKSLIPILRFSGLLAVLMIMLTNRSHAQTGELHFQNITTASGLSNRYINSIAQDSRGFIWFATFDGLNRYDGSQVKVFRHIAGDTNSIAGNWINYLYCDNENRLWICTNTGLSCMNLLTYQVRSYLHKTGDPGSIPSDKIATVYKDKKNRVWVGCAEHGLTLLDPATGRARIFSPLPGIHPGYNIEERKVYNSVYTITEDASGLLWLGSHNGIYSFDAEFQFSYKPFTPITPGKPRFDLISRIIWDNDTTFWFGTWGGGLVRFNTRNDSAETFLFNHKLIGQGTTNIILGLAHKDKDNLWLSTTDSGLGVFNKISRQFHFYLNNPADAKSLCSDLTLCILKDRSGIIWVGTDKGVDKMDPGIRYFTFNSLSSIKNSSDKQNKAIYDFYEDTALHKIYMAADFADGIYIKNQITGELYALPFPKTSDAYRSFKIFNDRQGTCWVLTAENVFQFDKRTEKFIMLPQPTDLTSNGKAIYLTDMVQDADGGYWFSSLRRGIFRYEAKQKKWTQFIQEDKIPGGICSNNLTAIFIDNKNNLWIASADKGFSIMNPKTAKCINFNQDQKNEHYCNSNFISGFLMDEKKEMWILTFDMGFAHYEPTSAAANKFHFFNRDSGLAGNCINKMVIDNYGNFWMATSSGISRFNPVAKQFKNYDEANGLMADANYEILFKAADGSMYAGTSNGFFHFTPSQFTESKKIAPVVLTSFKIFDHEYNVDSLVYEGRIKLSYKQNFFSFEFAALDYSSSEKFRYAYTLEGFDHGWIYSNNRRYASYTNLDGGNYTFRVKAANSDGVWNEKGFSIPIHIDKPFWKTWWFIIISALILVSASTLLIRLRIKGIREKERINSTYKQQLAETEMKALRSQMNPHFIFNSLNAINRYIVKSDQKTASLYLTRFSKLMRLILDNSNSKLVTLENDLSALKLYIEMEALRFNEKFNYEIRIDETISTENILIPPLLIQPYVENAIWHGLLHKAVPGNLLIQINEHDEILEISIADDGVGRSQAAALKSKSADTNKSYGMTFTNQRIALINEHNKDKSHVTIVDLVDSSGEPCGTRVTLNIPY